MRAVVMRPGAITVEERPMPTPGSGQVLVKSRACGICGSDLHLYRHAQEIIDNAVAAGVPESAFEAGLVMGHEYVAEIVAFGPDCKQSLSIGDRVCSLPFLTTGAVTQNIGADPTVMGAYAEYFLLNEDTLLKLPDHLTDEAAALTEPLAIAVHAVGKASVTDKDVAVVMGCGPIGLAAIAVLKMRGVGTIIAADYSARRRALAEEMGATSAVHPKEQSPFALLQEAQGSSAVVIDCTGVAGVFSSIVNEAPHGARVVVAGIVHGDESFTPAVAITKELSFHFVVYYQPEEFVEAFEALANDKVVWRPMVTGTVGLDQVADAFEALKDPEQHAKVLILPHGAL